MTEKIVKRCIRPQCRKIYAETEKSKFCMCGAILETVEIDIKMKINLYKKPLKSAKPKENPMPDTKAFLYLILDNDEVEFHLSDVTRIGRSTEEKQVDIDLSEYAGKEVSRDHAVIRREKDSYYITNVSRNHSVRIMDQQDNVIALEYGKKALLKTGNGIILSRKVLLQFEEKNEWLGREK